MFPFRVRYHESRIKKRAKSQESQKEPWERKGLTSLLQSIVLLCMLTPCVNQNKYLLLFIVPYTL